MTDLRRKETDSRESRSVSPHRTRLKIVEILRGDEKRESSMIWDGLTLGIERFEDCEVQSDDSVLGLSHTVTIRVR